MAQSRARLPREALLLRCTEAVGVCSVPLSNNVLKLPESAGCEPECVVLLPGANGNWREGGGTVTLTLSYPQDARS